MRKYEFGPLTQKVFDYLRDGGQGTANFIAEELDLELRDVQHAVKALHRKRKTRSKYIYVKRWVRGTEGTKHSTIRPVWAFGNKTDAKRPPAYTPAELTARYKAKFVNRYNTASVFSLANPVSYTTAKKRVDAQRKERDHGSANP